MRKTTIITALVLAAMFLFLVNAPLYTQVGTPARSIDDPSEFHIMTDRATGIGNINKFGRNPAVATGDEVIWDGSTATWAAPTAAGVHAIISDDPNDAAAGTGALTVEVYGLDPNYNLQNETVTLAALDPNSANVAVNTTNSYTMIHRMTVATAGGGGANVGVITATFDPNTVNTVTAQINAGNNQTLMAIYMIPGDKTGFITNYYATVNKDATPGTAAAANIELWVKPIGEVYQLKHILGVNTAGTSSLTHHFGIAKHIDAKSIILMEADPEAAMDVSAGFDLILVDN